MGSPCGFKCYLYYHVHWSRDNIKCPATFLSHRKGRDILNKHTLTPFSHANLLKITGYRVVGHDATEITLQIQNILF